MSGRRSRNKGAKAERDVVAWLQANGFPYAERRIGGMDGDKGDITGIGPLVIEVKDRETHTFPAYITQLEAEMKAAGVEDGFVIAKRRQQACPSKWYACLPAHVLIRLLREAGHGDGLAS